MSDLLHAPLSPLALLVALAAELWFLRILGDRVTGEILAGVSRARPGKRALLYILLAPGVILHELAHALAALACGCGIAKMVLFKPEAQEGGLVRLGYVQPRYKARSFVGEAVVSFAPVLIPPFLLYLTAPLAIPGARPLSQPQLLFSAALRDLADPLTLVWLFLFISMTLSSFPSDADFRVLGWKIAPVAALLLLPFAVALFVPGTTDMLLPYLVVFIFLLPSLLAAFLAAYLIGWAREARQTSRSRRR